MSILLLHAKFARTLRQSTKAQSTTQEEFENATITGHFGFAFEETSVKKIT